MKLDPKITQADIEALLRSQSELVYGADRTVELSSQIEHLSVMLTEIASRELDLRGPAPDISGLPDKVGR